MMHSGNASSGGGVHISQDNLVCAECSWLRGCAIPLVVARGATCLPCFVLVTHLPEPEVKSRQGMHISRTRNIDRNGRWSIL